jgi:hypothetical protein
MGLSRLGDALKKKCPQSSDIETVWTAESARFLLNDIKLCLSCSKIRFLIVLDTLPSSLSPFISHLARRPLTLAVFRMTQPRTGNVLISFCVFKIVILF